MQRARWYVTTTSALLCAGIFSNASGQAKPPEALSKPAAAAPAASTYIPEAMRLVSLPKMSEGRIKDFINDLALELELVGNYRRADAEGKWLRQRSDKIIDSATVVRKVGDKTDILQFGYIIAPRRTAKLAVYGISITPAGVVLNPDADEGKLDGMMKKLIVETAKMHSKLPLNELQSNIINLSYIDADGALLALRAMGYSAVTDDEPLAVDDSYKGLDVPLLGGAASVQGAPAPVAAPKIAADAAEDGPPVVIPKTITFSFDAPTVPGAPAASGDPNATKEAQKNAQSKATSKQNAIKNLPSSVDFDRLPLIFKMPTPDSNNVGLVGFDGAAAQGQNVNSLGLSMIPSAATQLGQTIASGTTQLLILNHPEDPTQFAKIKRIIEDVIDKPARQVFVEGLVLEISKQSIDELGVQWQNKGGSSSLQIGTLVQLAPNAGQAALQFVKDTVTAVDPRQFMARINALVDSNKAEVLSRPSVLTLDNRQATIRVGTDIPIATSKDASSGANSGRVAFSFQYLPTGILLNVRPRISQEGREISMLIDATVSATVPGQDLRVLDPTTGITLASAPSISTRRVQTYARISNNMPLIIGGLVSRDQTTQENKVPGVGDIPVLGKLFGYERSGDARREVIIVLTPSVLTEEFRATKPQLPKDDARFDLADTTLFREAFRIRAEDLIDSQYIRFNKRLITYRTIAQQVMARNPALELVKPFSEFRGTRVPGEFIFVSAMMHNMLKRVEAGKDVNIDKLNFFENTEGASFKTESVGGILKRYGDGKTHASFFKNNPGKALTLRFNFARDSTEQGQWASEPLAEVRLIDSPDRDAWRKSLWELNQPVEGVQKHYTIVLQDESDLDRLKLAIALKNTILANGNEGGAIFDNFLPGKMLAMQSVSPEWARVLEGTIGRYFFFGELYFPAFADAMEGAIRNLDNALRMPEMAKYLDGITLPNAD